VAEERSVREQISEQLAALGKSVKRDGPSISAGLRKLAQPAELTVGSAEFSTILAALDGFESGVMQATTQMRSAYEGLTKATEEQLSRWKGKESETLKEIETKRKALEAQGLRLDMAYIQKLTKDEAEHQKAVVNLNTWKPHLEELRKQRAEALKRRWGARDKVATFRDAYARHASDVLDRELSNPKVSLKFIRNGYSPAAADLITATMGWKTVQVPRAALLVEQLTVPTLLQAIQKKDRRSITDLKTPDGVRVFDSADATAIIEKLGQKHVQFALERCEVHDLPKLVVTKRIDEGGKARYVPREFGKLSLGQQQSVLLALILCSSGNHPLILDQPEDNLDGEFIYHTLVPVLRRAKERRQIVVVTHNANIAVLGDAELIVALKSGADKGMVVCRGSIDDTTTRDEACKILEGAKEAFQRRARTYGFRLTAS
jgi:energy-coupling factor transporter ATP-binding protein EcfA2